MIKSMTGFGRANIENDNYSINVEIKSLNSKIFDLKIKFSDITAEQEMDIRNTLINKLHRGKIDCNISVTKKNKTNNYNININVFDNYYKQLSVLEEKYEKIRNNTDYIKILMSLPEIMEQQNPELSDCWSEIMATIEKAAEELDNFRIQEGRATCENIISNLSKIEVALHKVPNFEAERIENVKNKLKTALETNNLNTKSDRFEAEIIYYIEKFDINEEKSRLQNHINFFRETVEKDNSGKKLNFITQEMGREINTLGSKANHFEIQKLVVAMKDELEKIKEQVLNIL